MRFFNIIASMPFVWIAGMFKNLNTVGNFFVLDAAAKHVKRSWLND